MTTTNKKTKTVDSQTKNKIKKAFRKSDKTALSYPRWYSPTVDTDWSNDISENYKQLVTEGEFDRFFTKL